MVVWAAIKNETTNKGGSMRLFQNTLWILACIAMFWMCGYNGLACANEWSGVVVHHTDSPSWTTVEDIDTWHKQKGWDGIGYHYVIYPDGSINIGRSLDKTGAHALGRNKTHIGIALVGYDEFSKEQKVSLARLVKEIGLPAERHHEQCPGRGIDIENLNQ